MGIDNLSELQCRQLLKLIISEIDGDPDFVERIITNAPKDQQYLLKLIFTNVDIY